MKIVMISDTHGNKPSLPPGDVLIHAGDFMTSGRNHAEMVDFLTYLRRVTPGFKKTLIVPGNHDRYVENNLATARQEIADAGGTLLVDEGIEIEGFSFWGTPWTPMFCNWAFMADESFLANKFDKIPPGLDMLVSHGPPKNILDRCQDGYHAGSQSLADRIKYVNPRNVVFGHIHEARGIEQHGVTNFYNVSMLNEDYRQAGRRPVEIEL